MAEERSPPEPWHHDRCGGNGQCVCGRRWSRGQHPERRFGRPNAGSVGSASFVSTPSTVRFVSAAGGRGWADVIGRCSLRSSQGRNSAHQLPLHLNRSWPDPTIVRCRTLSLCHAHLMSLALRPLRAWARRGAVLGLMASSYWSLSIER